MKSNPHGARTTQRPRWGLLLGLAVLLLFCLGASALRHSGSLPQIHKLDVPVKLSDKKPISSPAKAPARTQALSSLEELCGTYQWTYYDYSTGTTVTTPVEVNMSEDGADLYATFNISLSGYEASFQYPASLDTSTGQLTICYGQDVELNILGSIITVTLITGYIDDGGSLTQTETLSATFENGTLNFGADSMLGLYAFAETEEESGFYFIARGNVWVKDGYEIPEPTPGNTYTIIPDVSGFSESTYSYDGQYKDFISGTLEADGIEFATAIYQESSVSSTSAIKNYTSELRWYANTKITIDAPEGYLIDKITFLLSSSSKATGFTSSCGGTVTEISGETGNSIEWEDPVGVSQFSATASSGQLRVTQIVIEIKEKTSESSPHIYFYSPGTEMAPTINYSSVTEDGSEFSFSDEMTPVAGDDGYWEATIPADAGSVYVTTISCNEVGEMIEFTVSIDKVTDGYAYDANGNSWPYGGNQPIDPDEPEEDFYLIGSFNKWALADAAYRFHRESKDLYVLELTGTWDTDVQFKINGGSWDKANWGGGVVTPGSTYQLLNTTENLTLSRTVSNPRFEFNPEGYLRVIDSDPPEGSHFRIYGTIFGGNDYEARLMAENDLGQWTFTGNCSEGDFYIMEIDNATEKFTATFGPDTPMIVEFPEGGEATMEFVLSQNYNMFHMPAGQYTFTFSYFEMPYLTITGIRDPEPVVFDANIVYFDNSATQWKTPCVYWWNADGEAGDGWPGDAMTKIDGSDYWYYILPGDEDGMIFNASGSPQTADITGDDIVYNHIYTYTGSLDAPTHAPYTGPAPDIDAILGTYALDDAEWVVLCQIAESLAARGMADPWDMSCGPEKAYRLDGITVKDKHVTAIDLSGKSLTGAFPVEILALPALAELHLDRNNLEGKLDLAAAAISANRAAYPSTASLTTLTMTQNGFSGNIGLLAQLLPALRSLDASANCISDIYPPVAVDVNLLLNDQSLDTEIDLDFTNLDLEAVIGSIPSVVLYDHASQSYDYGFELYGINNNTGSYLYLQSYSSKFYIGTSSNGYHGQSGDILTIMSASGVSYGTTFGLKFSYAPADANMDARVDAADLQSTVNFAFDSYSQYLFNFSAADTYTDGTINVQDVVCTVNILLAQSADAVAAPRRMPSLRNSGSTPETRVYVNGTDVVLETAVPVAALQVKASGNITWDVPVAGISVASDAAGMVAYSLSGSTIAEGTTVIGHCDPAANIVAVSASDIEARSLRAATGQGSVSGIESAVSDSDAQSAVFDIYGRQTAAPTKGINIIVRNGRATKVFNR